MKLEEYKNNKEECQFCKIKNNVIYGENFYLQKTAGYELENMIYNIKIMKNKNDNYAGIMILNNGSNGIFFDINYCPICGRKLNYLEERND